jgi:cytochrome c biogenesis protein
VSRSPLAAVVFVGFALMVLGAGFALMLSHRRYWILVKPGAGEGCTVYFAGVARRHQQAFAVEHRRLAAELRRSLGDAVDARAASER